jgi:CBS domain-containing protein
MAHFAALPWWGLAVCAGVGIVAGLQSALLTKCLYWLEDGFERLPIHWMWWPALGGLMVGLGGLIEPRALGVGYDVIADLLNDRLLVSAVVAILLVKASIWLLALSSGTSGGVLAPLLILGGALGWLVGLALPGAPGFWALLGMAAMLGGTMRSPLTGAVFAVELTGDMDALTPLLIASAAAYAVTVLLLKRSILTEKIARRGGHVSREYAVDPFELTRVAEVMVREVDTLPGDLRIAEAIAVLQEGRHRIYPVLDDVGRPIGLVSRGDALRWLTEGGHAAERLADQVSDADVPRAYPDEVVARAVERMVAADQGRLPVVDRTTGRLVGLVTRRHLLQVRADVSLAEGERRAYFPPVRRWPNIRPA